MPQVRVPETRSFLLEEKDRMKCKKKADYKNQLHPLYFGKLSNAIRSCLASK